MRGSLFINRMATGHAPDQPSGNFIEGLAHNFSASMLKFSRDSAGDEARSRIVAVSEVVVKKLTALSARKRRTEVNARMIRRRKNSPRQTVRSIIVLY